jgi:hypothetical protein
VNFNPNCPACVERQESEKRRQLRAYRKRVGKPVAAKVRSYRCSRCDGFGHNTRSCPLPPDASES